MNKMKVVALSVFVLFAVLGTQHLPALFVLNSGSNPWLTDGGNRTALQIENSIVDGASFFLKGHADVLLFLNKIELANGSSLNYLELQALLDSAITHMENARAAYMELKTTACEKPGNSAALTQLKRFNYQEFQKANGLNPTIFTPVARYLHTGNVLGLFTHFYGEVEVILTRLHDLKATVAAGVTPETAKLWRLNQLFSETQLFGQYAAEVFTALEI